tara:strand:- start:29 stop:868 length:840 start_codon:yes stop_codon:yes gene_type:complete
MFYNLIFVVPFFIINFNQKICFSNTYKNKYNFLLKFEEEDFNIDGNFFNKTLPNNKNIDGIENIEYDEKNDMWIIDLNSYKSLDDIKLNVNNEINDTQNDNFPSFYEFLRKRELDEIKKKDNYLNKNKNIQPTSKDLKLLTSFSAMEWARTWIYEMVHVPDYFPTFMFSDMFRMRDFAQKNNSKHFFYIGYYPSDVNLKNGPFYIGAFELVPAKREFRTYLILQNPYYCAENIYDDMKIKNFKKELVAMTNDAYVFFKFENLKDSADQRYYYSWCYDNL